MEDESARGKAGGEIAGFGAVLHLNILSDGGQKPGKTWRRSSISTPSVETFGV